VGGTLNFAEKVRHACIKRIVIAMSVMCRSSQHGRSLCLKLKERVANVTFAGAVLQVYPRITCHQSGRTLSLILMESVISEYREKLVRLLRSDSGRLSSLMAL
jgi:hypothetical protein